MRPRSSLWLSISAGLASLFVALLYQSAKSFIVLPASEKASLLETVLIVSIGLFIIERLLLPIKGSSAESTTMYKGREGLLVRPLIVFVLLSISDGLLHDYLTRTVVPKGVTGIEQLVESFIAPFLITYSWIYGVGKRRRRARLYGLYSGAAVGLLSFSIIAVIVIQRLKSASIPSTLNHLEVVGLELIVSLAFFSWVLTCAIPIGYLGGLAIDREWCSHAWQSVAIGLIVAASVTPVSIGIMFTMLSAYTGRAAPGLFAWSFIVEPTIGNIGWAWGIALIPDADVILSNRRNCSSERSSVIGEIRSVVCAVVIMIISLVAFSLTCIVMPAHSLLTRGSHTAAAVTKEKSATPNH
jgi:hypothetical protein